MLIEGDYPPTPHDDATQWPRALAWLDESQQGLLSVVRGLDDKILHKPVLDYRTNPSGQGATRYETLIGLMQHDAYHSGQIALLKRM